MDRVCRSRSLKRKRFMEGKVYIAWFQDSTRVYCLSDFQRLRQELLTYHDAF